MGKCYLVGYIFKLHKIKNECGGYLWNYWFLVNFVALCLLIYKIEYGECNFILFLLCP